MKSPDKLAKALVKHLNNDGENIHERALEFQAKVEAGETLSVEDVCFVWEEYVAEIVCPGFRRVMDQDGMNNIWDIDFPDVESCIAEQANFYYDILVGMDTFSNPVCSIIEEFAKDLFTGCWFTAAPIHILSRPIWHENYQDTITILYGEYRQHRLLGIICEEDVFFRQYSKPAAVSCNLAMESLFHMGGLTRDNSAIDINFYLIKSLNYPRNGTPLLMNRNKTVIQEAFVAVADGDLSRVQYLIEEQGADIDARSTETSNSTLFHRAVLDWNEEIMIWLLEKGCRLDLYSDAGQKFCGGGLLRHGLSRDKGSEEFRRKLEEMDLMDIIQTFRPASTNT